jgi:hypothetical protein
LHATLNHYNECAAKMCPPKPTITWSQVVDLDVLSLVEILHSQTDICQERWAQPQFQAATNAWYKLQCAKEELLTIRVEAHHLWTSMHDVEDHLLMTLASLQNEALNLAYFITQTLSYHLSRNMYLWNQIVLLESLPGYTAKHGLGNCLHTNGVSATLLPLPHPISNSSSLSPLHSMPLDKCNNQRMESTDEKDEAEDDHDDYDAIMDRLANTLDSIAVDGL